MNVSDDAIGQPESEDGTQNISNTKAQKDTHYKKLPAKKLDVDSKSSLPAISQKDAEKVARKIAQEAVDEQKTEYAAKLAVVTKKWKDSQQTVKDNEKTYTAAKRKASADLKTAHLELSRVKKLLTAREREINLSQLKDASSELNGAASKVDVEKEQSTSVLLTQLSNTPSTASTSNKLQSVATTTDATTTDATTTDAATTDATNAS